MEIDSSIMQLLFYIILDVSLCVLLAFVIPLIKRKTDEMDNKYLTSIVDVFAKAAEQAYKNGKIEREERKEFLCNLLEDSNIVGKELIKEAMDGIDSELNAIIEASVYNLNNEQTKCITPVEVDINE